MEQVARCAAPRERLHQLLRRPFRSGMGGDVEMEEAPPIVRQDDKDIENSESDGRHDEEVRRDQLPHVVIKERYARSGMAVFAGEPCTSRPWIGTLRYRV